MLKILADENIPFVREACASLGEVRTMSGRAMRPEDLHETDVLFVRSVTRVGRALLEGSAVRFVGTATIGTDHVDEAWLADHGIGFAAAPGSNATSVAEYIVAALLCLAERRGLEPRDLALGVVGVGNVGSRVVARGETLGMRVLQNDPPLQQATGESRFLPLDRLLAECDAVTVHVPLTREGPDPTRHLIGTDFLRQLKPGAILLNTSRGGVHDTQALLRHKPAGLVLDVFENEPDISMDLLQAADLATPHIAGYSFDGKVQGTQMIYEAACRHLGLEPSWDPTPHLPPAGAPVRIAAAGRGERDVLRGAVRASYDIEADDVRLRALLALPAADRPAAFDRLRKQYPVRREFAQVPVRLEGGDERVLSVLAGLGFAVQGGV